MNRKFISFILALAMVLGLCFSPGFVEPSYAAPVVYGNWTVDKAVTEQDTNNVHTVTLTITAAVASDDVQIIDRIETDYFKQCDITGTDVSPAAFFTTTASFTTGETKVFTYYITRNPEFLGGKTVLTNRTTDSGVYATDGSIKHATFSAVTVKSPAAYPRAIDAHDQYSYPGNYFDLTSLITIPTFSGLTVNALANDVDNPFVDVTFTIYNTTTGTNVNLGHYYITRGATTGTWSWTTAAGFSNLVSYTTDQSFKLNVLSYIEEGESFTKSVEGVKLRVYQPVFNMNIVATDKAVDAYTTVDAITTCLTYGALTYEWKASDNATAPAVSGPAVEIDMQASHVTGPGVWVTPGAWYRTGLDDADFDVATVTAIVSGSATKTSIVLVEDTDYTVTKAVAAHPHDFTLLVTAKVVVDPNGGTWTTTRTDGVTVATTAGLWAAATTAVGISPSAYTDKAKFVYSSSMGDITQDVPTHPNPALIFSHWTVSDTAIGDYVPANPEKDFIRTYTANYALKKSLDYYDDDAVTTLAATEYYPLNTTQSVLHQNPTKAGFIFLGWGTSSNPAVTTTIANIYMDADKAVYAKWVPSFTLTYNMNGGTPAYPVEEYASGAAATASIVAKSPTKAGNSFGGWFLDAGFTQQVTAGSVVLMTTDRAVYAKWNSSPSGPPGGPVSSNQTLKYESNGGTKFNNETYPKGTKVPEATVNAKTPVKTGFTFGGWYLDSTLTKPVSGPITMDKDVTVYAKWNAGKVPPTLNGDDHFAYIIGYDTGDVRPLANIPRSEVATIFFRLLKDDIRDGNFTKTNNFKDIDPKAWYNNPISTMSKLGIVSGDPNGKFRPEEPITRAEFATICARFDTSTPNQTPMFTDVQNKSDHWAFEYINKAAALGWINGYEDGTFRPDDYITRAEAMTVINRVLLRIPETENDLLPKMVTWVDNPRGEWYYLAVQEATNSHDFSRKSNGVNETWTKFTEPRDWSTYEK